MQVVVAGQRRRRIGKSLRTELRPGVGRAVLAEVVSSKRDEARKLLSIQLWQGGAAVRGFVGYRDALGVLIIPDSVRPPAHASAAASDALAADVVLVDGHLHLQVAGVRGEELSGPRLAGILWAASVSHDIDPRNGSSLA